MHVCIQQCTNALEHNAAVPEMHLLLLSGPATERGEVQAQEQLSDADWREGESRKEVLRMHSHVLALRSALKVWP